MSKPDDKAEMLAWVRNNFAGGATKEVAAKLDALIAAEAAGVSTITLDVETAREIEAALDTAGFCLNSRDVPKSSRVLQQVRAALSKLREKL